MTKNGTAKDQKGTMVDAPLCAELSCAKEVSAPLICSGTEVAIWSRAPLLTRVTSHDGAGRAWTNPRLADRDWSSRLECAAAC